MVIEFHFLTSGGLFLQPGGTDSPLVDFTSLGIELIAKATVIVFPVCLGLEFEVEVVFPFLIVLDVVVPAPEEFIEAHELVGDHS